jgi:transposase InsO family protein
MAVKHENSSSENPVTVNIPDELDPGQTQAWLQSLVSEKASITRLRTAAASQEYPPGPGVMHQIGRIEAAWRTIAERYGLLEADDVARLMGAPGSSVRTWIHNQRRRNGLLAVRRGGRNVYPGFQFTADGRIQPWLRPVTGQLLDAGWTEEAVLLWLAAPTGQLSGQAPLEVVDADPERVHHAAEAAASGLAA